MESRTCLGCGTSLALYREGARTCSPACRKRASRMREFPAEMTEKDRWVRRMASKRPVTVSGRAASSTNAATWSSYAAAKASDKGVGTGFVLGAGVGCIDLDHCFEDGELAGWARTILGACPATFVEVSQSGEGLHIFGLLPEGEGRNMRDGMRAVEVYSTGRYIATTGNRFEGAPLALADLSGVVATLI